MKYIINPMEQKFHEWNKFRSDNLINKILSSPVVYNENIEKSKPWEIDPIGWEEEHY